MSGIDPKNGVLPPGFRPSPKRVIIPLGVKPPPGYEKKVDRGG